MFLRWQFFAFPQQLMIKFNQYFTSESIGGGESSRLMAFKAIIYFLLCLQQDKKGGGRGQKAFYTIDLCR